jgi:KDEL-tailed cysteine endopeptidase
MDQAFWYIIDNGIAQYTSYPDRTLSKCKYVMNMKYTGISRCARVPSRSYSKLLSAIVQQPVSVVIDLNSDIKDYKSGIYSGKCTSNINHGMLLVGYGGK